MKYAVMFEPFGKYEYICENDYSGGWAANGNPKYFKTKEEAEIEAEKWNTGKVVEIKEINE